MSLAMPDDYESMSDEELANLIRRMKPAKKGELAERVEKRTAEERKVWFCGDRRCNGKPHGVYNYKHARGSTKPDGSGSQYPPLGTQWLVWLLRGGRGSGKTRTGSEYTRYIAKKIPWLALIGPTGPAVRSVMIEGESGLIASCEAAGETHNYEPSKQRFTFANGARAQLFSAEEPDRIRGHQFGFLWGDEPAHWDDPRAVWDMSMFALRLGRRPHALATTTPLPNDFMKELIEDDETVAVGASTYDNMDNLAEVVVRRILKRYEGTYLGRQEIHGEMVDDREGALWHSEQFMEKDFYFEWDVVAGSFDRVVVGVDPAGSNNKRSDLTGIVVGGKKGDVVYAIDDFSGKYAPAGWAEQVIIAAERYKADAVVVEKNYGGQMVRQTLVTAGYKGRIIEAQATDGKRVRAEPVSALYEQHRARHRRGGKVAKLESEMVSWIPGEGKSPNRIDAWVWCVSSLTKGGGRMDMGDPTQGAPVGPQPYRGPGSNARKKEARRGVGFRRR